MISKKQKRQGNVLVDDYYVYDKNTSEWKMILENEVMK